MKRAIPRMIGAMTGMLALPLAAHAFAATGSALDRLPSEVRGVVGSGDQLSLELRSDGVDRVIHLGESYKDGWTLQALTPSQATLARDGQTRQVGLSPSGALAELTSPAAPSSVDLAGIPADDDVTRILESHGVRVPSGLRTGLTDAELRRSIAYSILVGDMIVRTGGRFTAQDIREALGPAAFDDQAALERKAGGS